MQVLRIEPRSSETIASAFDHWVILCNTFLKNLQTIPFTGSISNVYKTAATFPSQRNTQWIAQIFNLFICYGGWWWFISVQLCLQKGRIRCDSCFRPLLPWLAHDDGLTVSKINPFSTMRFCHVIIWGYMQDITLAEEETETISFLSFSKLYINYTYVCTCILGIEPHGVQPYFNLAVQ